MHDAVQMERRGVPTVSLATHTFESAARAQARVMGIPDLHLVVVPREIYDRGTPEEAKKAADGLYPQVIEALSAAPKYAQVQVSVRRSR